MLEQLSTLMVYPAMGGGWRVRRHLARRAMRVFRTFPPALAYGRGLAKKRGVDLCVFNSDGGIVRTEDYAPTAQSA
ncbi:MAG: DUF2188 domain-containing protein [Acidobacteria bacterium]|nr:DUF2188 domain-containing protein [Acidobacteriota bacterium]